MTRRKANYGRLLNKFADRKSKPTSSADPRVSIRLPSTAELLAIDARAEQAANRARIKQAAFEWFETTGMTHGTADVAAGTR